MCPNGLGFIQRDIKPPLRLGYPNSRVQTSIGTKVRQKESNLFFFVSGLTLGVNPDAQISHTPEFNLR